jgi:hypothetical protein
MSSRWFVLLIPIFLLLLVLIGFWQKRRRQVRFIQKTLTNSQKFGDNRRVIVSLSTVPDRIENLEPTLRCLLNQTRPPDEIVIAIPDFSIREQRSYVVPAYLTRLSGVNILRCGKDWGPATKFIPAIQAELGRARGNTLMMVVDDDRIYPRDALETYLHYTRQLPDAALCFRGSAMPPSLDWRNAKMIRASVIREPQRVAVITGCGSYLIQPRFFDESLWDYSRAPAGAFYMDDIWISGCLGRRGVARYVVPASAMMRTVFQQFGTLTLHDVPNGRQPSNNETIAFFRDTWDVFRSV